MTQDQQILEGLYSIGFLFPDTAARVEAYEEYQKVFGDPDINFPIEEADLIFEKIMLRLHACSGNKSKNNVNTL